MPLTKQEQLEKLLLAYAHHYDIQRDAQVGERLFPAKATYFLRDENYLISKKHVLSAVENHGHVYFYLTDHLDAPLLQTLMDETREAGLALVRPHKEHMSTFVSLVVLADTITPEAKQLIRKTRFRKNYRLALHGWMEYQITAHEVSTDSCLSNPAGRAARKTLEQNLCSRAH